MSRPSPLFDKPISIYIYQHVKCSFLAILFVLQQDPTTSCDREKEFEKRNLTRLTTGIRNVENNDGLVKVSKLFATHDNFVDRMVLFDIVTTQKFCLDGETHIPLWQIV